MPLVLASCLKDELPVPMHDRGGFRTVDVCLGTGYQDQLWMDLSSGEVVSINARTAWDLAFESDLGGWHILLNGSRLMTVMDLGAVPITAQADTVGMFSSRRIDAPNGDLDSTAILDHRGLDHVYLLDLGYNGVGEWMGVKKLRIISVNELEYRIEFAEMDGTQVVNTVVPKDPNRTYTCFSFANGVLPIEPQAGEWDLVLTQFTHIFLDLDLPYLVTGFLSAEGVRVAELDDKEFSEVTLADTLVHPFHSDRDAIGYDWKTYSFETSSYTVETQVVFIVEDARGFFHKIRFLEFYGPQGQTGCPKFEIVGL